MHQFSHTFLTLFVTIRLVSTYKYDNPNLAL